MRDRLKKWEAALLLAVCVSLCCGAALPNTLGCNWWGVVFPGFAEETDAAAAAWSAPGLRMGGVELRFRLLDCLAAIGKGGKGQ